MQTHDKPRPPSAEDFDSFELEQDAGTYFILKGDRVWFEPKDGEAHYVHSEDYPAGITAEFERRNALKNKVPRASPWHGESEGNVPLFVFDQQFRSLGEARRAYRECWGPALEQVRKSGQFTAKVRLAVPNQKAYEDLYVNNLLGEIASVFREHLATVAKGAIIGKASETGMIYYIPLTITW